MTADEPDPTLHSSRTLVLYDGVCGLCNRLVAFLIRHDHRDQFLFAPLQSPLAHTLLRRYDLNPHDLDSVVVIADLGRPTERALTRSRAALWAIGRVGGIWRIFVVGQVIPLPLREALYKAIASRRYRIFGKYTDCPLPRPQDRHKFLTSALPNPAPRARTRP